MQARLRPLALTLAAALLAIALPAPALAAPVAATADVEVIAGASRFDTAVAVSAVAYPATARAVVLATGLAWPDALGGSSLAGAAGGPVLLAQRTGVPGSVLAEVARVRPDIVYVLGGSEALGDAALAQVAASIPASSTVVRLGGATRYATAALVASATIAANGGWDGSAFVATGRTYPDALAAGPVAAALGRPLYLIDEGSSADAVLAAMDAAGVTHATVLGGTAAVSSALEARIAAAVGSVDRLAGGDRFATALAIAAYAEAEAGFAWTRPGLATGDDFADALAAAPLLGARRAPLLLAQRTGLPDRIAAACLARAPEIAGFTAFGGTAALPAHVRQEALHALVAPHFDSDRAMEHIRVIAGLGPRGAGGAAERAACDYVSAQLAGWGYTVTTQSVPIPDGRYSRNVIAEKPGTRPEVVVLGAHIDSKPPSPGGNDNASGVAVMLELARVLADAPVRPTVRFIAFGAEEIGGPTPDDHHFGSRQYVASLSAAERAAVSGMVSIDMVGYGSVFNVRNLGWAPQTTVTSLQARGSFVGQPLPYLKDFGRSGWSDHEQFERVGIPSAWLEWREDPVYHTTRDTASHVQGTRIRASGRLVRGWLLGMTDAGLDALR